MDPQAAARIAQLEQLALNMAQLIQNQNNNNNHYEPDWAKKIFQMKPDFYQGKEDPTELEDWIRNLDKILDVVNCPDEHRVNGVVYYFKGEADNWWSASRDGLLAQPNFSWDDLKFALRERFYPQHVQAQKYEEFLTLK